MERGRNESGEGEPMMKESAIEARDKGRGPLKSPQTKKRKSFTAGELLRYRGTGEG